MPELSVKIGSAAFWFLPSGNKLNHHHVAKNPKSHFWEAKY